jgi:hypothetical protein
MTGRSPSIAPHLNLDANLDAPFGHDAESLDRFVGFGLDFAPFRMIAKVKHTEMVDRFLDAWAGADDEDSYGFGDRSTGLTDRSSNVHTGVLSF